MELIKRKNETESIFMVKSRNQKSLKNNGYGKFYFNNKSIPAHRYSISLTGKDPAGWEVLHSCDNPPCVNPAHLRLGTHAENMKEAKDRKRFPFNIFLHHFLKGDPDDVHDHPWNYATIILKGGYYEWVATFNPEGEKVGETRYWRGPGHMRLCRANSFHRIELKEGVQCWTLFMPGPQKRNWGFDVKGQWIDHETYLESRKNAYQGS